MIFVLTVVVIDKSCLSVRTRPEPEPNVLNMFTVVSVNKVAFEGLNAS